MSDGVTLRITGTDLVIRNLNAKNADIERRLRRWFQHWAIQLEGKAKKKLRWWSGPGTGGRFTGRLSRSITHELHLEGGWRGWSARVGPGVDYGKYVHGYPQAPRKHFLPYQNKRNPELGIQIKRWARRHGIDTEATWGIEVGGPGSTVDFLLSTLNENAHQIWASLQAALRVDR